MSAQQILLISPFCDLSSFQKEKKAAAAGVLTIQSNCTDRMVFCCCCYCCFTAMICPLHGSLFVGLFNKDFSASV